MMNGRATLTMLESMVDRKTPDPTSRSVWYFLLVASLFCWFAIWEGLKIFEKSQDI
jgi:hypothetical protein